MVPIAEQFYQDRAPTLLIVALWQLLAYTVLHLFITAPLAWLFATISLAPFFFAFNLSKNERASMVVVLAFCVFTVAGVSTWGNPMHMTNVQQLLNGMFTPESGWTIANPLGSDELMRTSNTLFLLLYMFCFVMTPIIAIYLAKLDVVALQGYPVYQPVLAIANLATFVGIAFALRYTNDLMIYGALSMLGGHFLLIAALAKGAKQKSAT